MWSYFPITWKGVFFLVGAITFALAVTFSVIGVFSLFGHPVWSAIVLIPSAFYFDYRVSRFCKPRSRRWP